MNPVAVNVLACLSMSACCMASLFSIGLLLNQARHRSAGSTQRSVDVWSPYCFLLQIFETAYIMHLRRRRFFGGSSEKLPFISQRRHSLAREKVTQALYTTKAAFSQSAEGEAQHTSVTNSATLGVSPLQTRDPCACDAAALQQLLCALQYTRSTSLGILDQVFATARRSSTMARRSSS